MAFLYRPSHWSWVSLSGPDAQDFLHRVTTVNLRAMAPGEGAPGCLLSGQGKIHGWFHLWNIAPAEYGFEFDAGEAEQWKKELLASLDRITFAEKMTVTDVTALASRWILTDAEEAGTLLGRWGASELTAGKTTAIDEEIRINHHGDREFGRVWLSVWGREQRLAQWLDRALPEATEIGWDKVNRWRIEQGRPWMGSEITESTIPLEVGLTDTIAPNKGCYPGQEVVERIIAHGSPAKRLCTIRGKAPAPAPGTVLLNDAEPAAEVGQVTSSVVTDGGFVALAIIRKIQAKEGLSVKWSGGSATVERVAPYA